MKGVETVRGAREQVLPLLGNLRVQQPEAAKSVNSRSCSETVTETTQLSQPGTGEHTHFTISGFVPAQQPFLNGSVRLPLQMKRLVERHSAYAPPSHWLMYVLPPLD